MSFIGNKALTDLLAEEDVISNHDVSRIKNGAYEMSLGGQVFQTDSSPKAVKELKEGEQIEIRPGQFALLLTKEYVKIPTNKIAFISIKAGVKFKGLVNVSGFHVDPGFEGNLLFSVYNAGPSNIVLSSGTAYFPIWFAALNESQDYKGRHEKQTRIPDEPVEALSQGDIASPAVLSKRIDDNLSVSNQRISVLERDQKANNYLSATAIGVVFAVLLKFLFDWVVLDTGLKKGMDIKGKENYLDSLINVRRLEEKQLILEINMLKKKKDSLSK